MDPTELIARLRGVDPAALADADKSIRVIAPEIRPVRLGLTLLGPAYTVRCTNDFFAIIAALEDARPGDVLVVDTQGSTCAVVGELFSLEAARLGLGGIVIDGACRDLSTIRTLELPVYARSITPVSGTVNAVTYCSAMTTGSSSPRRRSSSACCRPPRRSSKRKTR